MRIVDCIWEQANLDSRVAEISVEAGDEFPSDLLSDMEKDYDYIVLKFAVNNFNNYFSAAQKSYAFIETQISVQKRLKDWNLSPADTRLFKNFSISEVDSEQGLNGILAKIDDSMFTTDRIYLDPLFGPNYSAKRYKNWIRTEFEKGAILHKLLYRNTEIGFGISRIADDVLYGIIGGLYGGKGLGIIVPSYPLLLKEKRFDYFRTKISMNNTPVLRIYNHFNFEITDTEYVFVKHIQHK